MSSDSVKLFDRKDTVCNLFVVFLSFLKTPNYLVRGFSNIVSSANDMFYSNEKICFKYSSGLVSLFVCCW